MDLDESPAQLSKPISGVAKLDANVRQRAISESGSETHSPPQLMADLPVKSHPLLPVAFLKDGNATTTQIGGEFVPGDPIFIAGDGTIKAAPASSSRAAVDSNNVNYLLQHKDWSKTPLGPLENWPESLRSIST